MNPAINLFCRPSPLMGPEFDEAMLLKLINLPYYLSSDGDPAEMARISIPAGTFKSIGDTLIFDAVITGPAGVPINFSFHADLDGNLTDESDGVLYPDNLALVHGSLRLSIRIIMVLCGTGVLRCYTQVLGTDDSENTINDEWYALQGVVGGSVDIVLSGTNTTGDFVTLQFATLRMLSGNSGPNWTFGTITDYESGSVNFTWPADYPDPFQFELEFLLADGTWATIGHGGGISSGPAVCPGDERTIAFDLPGAEDDLPTWTGFVRVIACAQDFQRVSDPSAPFQTGENP